MTPKVFFDTNIILYFFGDEGYRTEAAERLLVEGGVVSIQVLNELVSVAHGKLRMNVVFVGQRLSQLDHFRGNIDPVSLGSLFRKINR